MTYVREQIAIRNIFIKIAYNHEIYETFHSITFFLKNKVFSDINILPNTKSILKFLDAIKTEVVKI